MFRTLGSLDYTEMKMKQIAGKVQAQEASINLIEGCLFQTFHFQINRRSSFQIISLVKTLTFIEHTVLHSSRQLFSLPEGTVIMNLPSESHTHIPKSMCCIFESANTIILYITCECMYIMHVYVFYVFTSCTKTSFLQYDKFPHG